MIIVPRRKKTDTEFKHEVYDLVGDEYIFLEPYVNTHTKIQVKHNLCGNVYGVIPNNFLHGTRCPYCNIEGQRKTDEQFKKGVFDLVGNEYTFLDPYVNNHTKLRVKHNTCGTVYKVTPNDFLGNKRCPKCFGTPKKTNAQFKQEVYDLVGNEYTILDPYINNRTKIKVKHNKCGYVYSVVPTSFLSGHYCPYCAGVIKKTDAQFRQGVKDLVGEEYSFLGSYVDAKTKLKVKHNKCGNIYEVTPNNFLRGRRCPYCSGYMKKTDAQFKQEVEDLVGDEYIFLDTYVNADTKIRVKHNKCEHIYEVRPADFLSGTRCPYCSGRMGKTDVQFKQEVYDLVRDEYTFLDTYVDSKTKIRVKHNKCGNTYEVRPSDFISHNTRCPYCNSSKGEDIITRILNNLNIHYEPQKTFDDLVDKTNLSYDFFIPNQNILIEYQGVQHYEPIDIFGGDERLKYQQKHDRMKADYAKSHNYNLIAVPYTQDTFSKIKKYLVKHGLKH